MVVSEDSMLAAQSYQNQYPLAGPRFHVVAATLGALLVGGIYLVGWAANHSDVENPVISFWAVGMYVGYLLIAALLIRSSLSNHAAGYPWQRSLPPGYGLALVGVVLFAVGAIVEAGWQLIIGAETPGIERLITPGILLMVLGVVLIITGPWRPALLDRSSTRPRGWAATAPLLLSALSLLSILTFATQYAHPVIGTFPAPATRTPMRFNNIYTMQSDGTHQTRLVIEPQQYNCCTAWSPDGRTLALTIGTPPASIGELYLADADGSHPRQLTRNGRVNFLPAWSPDGTRIAFISQAGNDVDTAEVFVINADGSGERRLTNNTAWEYGVTWSPDSTHIAFGSQRDGRWYVYVSGADGSNPTRLPESFDGNAPAWSPDGQSILFTSNRTGNDSIYIMNADGSNVRRLTPDDNHHDNAVWSPDGTRIAYSADLTGNNEIYVMNADGSGATNISRNPALWHNFPRWSPDGRTISYTAAGQTTDTKSLSQPLGVASILIQSAILMGLILVLIRSWRLPFGLLTLLITINAALMSAQNDQYAFVVAALGVGLTADLLMLLLKPSVTAPLRWYSFASLVPLIAYTLYFLTLFLTKGIDWSAHLWVGSIVLASLTGLVIGFLLSTRSIGSPEERSDT